MKYLVPLMGIAAGLMMLIAGYLRARTLPRKDAMSDVSGTKFLGMAQIDWENYTVAFVVGSEKLWILSFFPNIGLALDIHELELSKKKCFIGYQVRIVSHDVYTEHLFKEIIVSARVAKKLEKLTYGKLVVKGG
ncbi:hypothetical protein ACFSJ3_10865 [Corallincola platygyrae]|uniref:Uncharacterized protein n=1 Tax=Corallincola platygyrae TaxID=1193278 RepID=A0ABW4XLN2_9GAMM